MKQTQDYSFPSPSVWVQVKEPSALSSYFSFPKNSPSFRELNVFRSQMNTFEDCKYGPYALFKKKTLIYKSIFIALAAFFLILGTFILSKPLFWSFPLLSGARCLMIKYFLGFMCFGITSFIYRVQIHMQPETEATSHFLQHYRSQLAKIYRRKKLELGFSIFMSFISSSPQYTHLQQDYQTVMHDIQDDQEEIFFLFDKIRRSPYLNYQSRELLYNQAILELKQKLNHNLETFRQNVS
jgi:hypothetical protein